MVPVAPALPLLPPAPLPGKPPPAPVPLLLVVAEPDPLPVPVPVPVPVEPDELVVLLEEPGVQSSMQSPVVAVALVAQQVKPVGHDVLCEQTGALAGKPVLVV